jgi:5-methylcytosine-specific restriction endonuclease McrA
LDCEQKIKNERKNVDRAQHIIRQRAATHARKAGKPAAFFWNNMNYRALVPVFRAMMTEEGLCTSCGHGFEGENDITIEHREPPRHAHDWARLHARNLDLGCRGCNSRKNDRVYSDWLDLEEEVRLSNEADLAEIQPDVAPDPEPGTQCESVKEKWHCVPLRRSTWRCKGEVGHEGLHWHPGQSPWT